MRQAQNSTSEEGSVRSEVLEVPEVKRCVLLCMPEAVECGLCLLNVLGMLEVVEVMRRVLLRILGAAEGRLCSFGGAGGAGGDALCAAL